MQHNKDAICSYRFNLKDPRNNLLKKLRSTRSKITPQTTMRNSLYRSSSRNCFFTPVQCLLSRDQETYQKLIEQLNFWQQ
ncbi:hypothetical protein ACH3XW_20005 [Acanthocheilonema viteae]